MPEWLRNLGFAAALLAAQAGVYAPAAAAAGMVSASDITSVTGALAAAGYKSAIKRDDEGGRYILVNEGEEEFSIDFGDCEDDIRTIGCKLLIFNALWEAGAAFDGEIVNRFNQTATLAHAFVDEDGTLNLTLAVTTKAGLPAENFAEIIAIWRASDAALSALIDAEPEIPSGKIVAALSVP